MKGTSVGENNIEQQLRDTIEAIIGSAPYALCFDATPLEDMFSDEPFTITQVVQPLRQATYTTRGLFESGCDILTCELREGDNE